MINTLLLCSLYSILIMPGNAFLDRYTLIPPLGTITSVAVSLRSVYATNDNYLLVFEKQKFALEKTLLFDKMIHLVGYDPYYDDVWILSENSMIRLNALTYSAREFQINSGVSAFGIGNDYLFLDGVKDFRLDKRTGELQQIYEFPGNLTWYRRTTTADMRKYPFLTPYYYYDKPEETQIPFHEFAITALYEDGIDLYVGTDHYGILKYNTISWDMERLVYGPLDSRVHRVRKFEDQIYLISPLGISYFPRDTRNWRYQRFAQRISDILPLGNTYLFSIGNRLSQMESGVAISIGNATADILSLHSDETHIYIGTRSGLLRMQKGGRDPAPFGPDRYAVYSIYSTNNKLFAGDEFSLYEYDCETQHWAKILPFGIKDIVEVKGELYLLGINNQLMRYQLVQDSVVDDTTNWFLLPYFNIYDIETDNEVLYCASFAGVYVYEPETELYQMVSSLPSLSYDHVFVIDSNIVAVSKGNLFTLPVKYRD